MDKAELIRRLELEKLLGADVLWLGERAEAAPTQPAQHLARELRRIEREVMECTACDLHSTRTQGVFARGNPQAELMFIGEAPGAEEDRQGEPFVGPAGQLLDKMIYAMGMRRDEVYITNILKSRPPGNRDPRPAEISACWHFLARQIELVAPRVICTLGRPASNTLLNSNEAMGRMRGRWHDYEGIPLRPTYHPAYLLRSPSQKAKTWEDLKEIVLALRGD